MPLTCKEYLEQIKKIDTLIRNKKIEKGLLHQQTIDVALSITAGSETVMRKEDKKTGEVIAYGVERVKSSSNGHSFADAVINNVDAFNRLDKQIKNLESRKNEIIENIERLDEPEYDVLHMVYVQYLTFEEAAAKRDKSKSWIKNHHNKALESLAVIANLENISENV